MNNNTLSPETKKQEVKLTARARCFRGANGGAGILGSYQFTIEADGTVRVYDSIAKHFTLHHGMTPREEGRIRNLAAKREVFEEVC